MDNNVKVGQFSLLTTVNPHQNGPTHVQKHLEEITHDEKKERLAEYHRKVNERRRIIAKKAEAKRVKEAKELDAMTEEERQLHEAAKNPLPPQKQNVMPSLKGKPSPSKTPTKAANLSKVRAKAKR